MDDLEQKIADWVNLPLGIEPISLWCSLHDASLLSVSSDLLARTLTLHFDPYYLCSFHNLGEGITLSLLLKGVQSVRAFRWSVWPGDFQLPPGTGEHWDEHQKMMAEFRKLWRQESESWETFQSSVNSDEDAEINRRRGCKWGWGFDGSPRCADGDWGVVRSVRQSRGAGNTTQ
jgi:hypothetical protein